MAKYFLGKFFTGKASASEIADAASAVGLDSDDLDDNRAPHIYGILLSSYGPDKLAEVEEALEIAIQSDHGDIASKLEEWKRDIARRQAQSVSGLAALGRKGLGPKSTADTESLIGEFITGKKGSLTQQMEALKKQATGTGGRRKTRRRKAARRKTRTAKKSRRTYK